MTSGLIKVDVSESGIRAYITVRPNADPEFKKERQMPTVEEILQELDSAGIVVGIDEDAIRSIVEEKRWNEQVLVAAGKPPANGAKGRVEYFFDTNPQPRPKEIDGGKVDYREIGLVNTVEKDQVLARRFLPTEGVPGITVRGDEIVARNGEEVFILAGQNTHFTDEKETELRSSVSGSVYLRRGVVHVEKTFQVKGNVDFSTGNIDFPEDVIITGDVTAGFKVRSGGNIEIRGVVEDALVVADGDVLVKGGFTGSGRGVIRSKGNVFIKFVENQTIEAGGSVHVGEACIHATISAGDKIVLETGHGTVIGGHLKATRGIKAKILGNPQYTVTTVEVVGTDDQFDPELKAKKESITARQEEVTGLKAAVFSLQQKGVEGDDFDPKLMEELREKQDRLYSIYAELEDLRRDLHAMNADGGCPGTIHVLKKVYPGTHVIISGVQYEVNEEGSKAVFINIGGEVVDLPSEMTSLAD